jgi:hypothetical protein
MSDGEVVELLKIANGYLPRVRLEYDRIKEEINYSKAELNSWKAEVNNEVRIYQDFCNRNLALKNREGELQRTIDELEAKKTKLNESLSEFEESDMDKENFNLEVKQEEEVTSMTQHPNMTVDYPTLQGKSRTIIFDTKNLL